MAASNQLWWRAQRQLLTDLPATQLGCSEQLLEQAKAKPVSRRLLACRARAADEASVLQLPLMDIAPVVERAPWLHWPRHAVESAVADLGAMALLPGLRQLVERASVLGAREQLGEPRFRWALRMASAPVAEIAPAVIAAATRETRQGLAESDLLQRAKRLGLREMRAYYPVRYGPQGLARQRLDMLFADQAEPANLLGWLAHSTMTSYWLRRAADEPDPDYEQA